MGERASPPIWLSVLLRQPVQTRGSGWISRFSMTCGRQAAERGPASSPFPKPRDQVPAARRNPLYDTVSALYLAISPVRTACRYTPVNARAISSRYSAASMLPIASGVAAMARCANTPRIPSKT